MKAAIYGGPDEPVSIRQVADPEPKPDELLIEVARCGICGSDVSMISGGIGSRPGRCFGHEYSGTVQEVGSALSGWRRGDRVACLPTTGCGECAACREGRVILCQRARTHSEGFAELIAVPAVSAILLPASLSLADGALIEPMACGLHALNSVGSSAGKRILVLGAGSMALSAVWWARRLGAASVVVASRSSHRADLCVEFGATAVHSFDWDKEQGLETALGGPPDIVVECVGKPGMLSVALGHVRPGGQVVSMGMCTHSESITPARLAFAEARLCFPLGYSPEEFAQTARALDQGGVNPERMVGHVGRLDELPDYLTRLKSGEPLKKVQIDPRV